MILPALFFNLTHILFIEIVKYILITIFNYCYNMLGDMKWKKVR